MLEPVKKVRLSDMVVKQIKDLIITKKVTAGDCLGSEREMCRNLNVSRSVLREALASIQVQGFIRISTNGIFVESIAPNAMKEPIEQLLAEDEKKIFELTEVRKVLESGMAFSATEISTSEDIEKVKLALASLEKAYANQQLGNEENVRFHLKLAECTHNTIYIHLLYTVMDVFSKASILYRSRLSNKPENAKILMEQHQEIYRCLVAKDPDRLSRAIIGHLSWADNEVRKLSYEDEQ